MEKCNYSEIASVVCNLLQNLVGTIFGLVKVYTYFTLLFIEHEYGQMNLLKG